MKNKLFLAIVLGIFVLAGITVFYYRSPSATIGDKPTVAATFQPLTFITNEIAGDDFEVINILPPGASPHTFEPTPDLILKMQNVKTIFMIGHGIDDWATVLANNLSGVEMMAVDRGIALKKPLDVRTYGVGDEEHEDGSVDPHYWLTPENGKIIASDIADKLQSLAPEKKSAIAQRLASFKDKMNLLDSRIKQLFATKNDRRILTHHNAWQYFANDYGLQIVGVVEPSPGQTLTANELADLQETIRSNRINTLFIEPELSQASVAPLANDLKLQIKTLDPEGGTGAADYGDMLWRNAKTIAESL